jgi:hypothetical protein|tara:strand:+ start:271 stop:465 length:195 start_codon:yes stop_codon:yes gene_type:complete
MRQLELEFNTTIRQGVKKSLATEGEYIKTIISDARNKRARLLQIEKLKATGNINGLYELFKRRF